MNHANDPGEWVAKALKGELTEAEQRQFQQRLQNEPALRAAFEEEQRLEHLIGRLPNVPVSTNFTSLVLQAVRREERRPARSEGRFGWLPFLRGPFPRVAAGLAAVLLAGVVGVRQYRQSQQTEMARSVSAFTEVASAIGSEETPPPAVFRDFEAIQRLSIPREPELDLELLFALQK